MLNHAYICVLARVYIYTVGWNLSTFMVRTFFRTQHYTFYVLFNINKLHYSKCIIFNYLTMSYYKLGNLFVCVCRAIRFHISLQIFSKCGGNILWVMTRIVGNYMFSARSACACMLNVRACVHSLIFGTDSLQMCWEHTPTHHKWRGLRTFHVHSPRTCVRARAHVYVCSSLNGFSPNLVRTYNISTEVTRAV
jgi:hypothetical protein